MDNTCININTSFNRLYDAYAEAKCRAELGHGLTRSAEGSLSTMRAVTQRRRDTLTNGQVKAVYAEALNKASAVGDYRDVVGMVDAVGSTGLFDRTRLTEWENRASDVWIAAEEETEAERVADQFQEGGSDEGIPVQARTDPADVPQTEASVPSAVRKAIGDRPVLGWEWIDKNDHGVGKVWRVADMDGSLENGTFSFYYGNGEHVHEANRHHGMDHQMEEIALREGDADKIRDHLQRRAEDGKSLNDYDYGDRDWDSETRHAEDIVSQRRAKYRHKKTMSDSEFRETYGHSKWEETHIKPEPSDDVPDFEGTDAGTAGGIQSGDELIGERTDPDSGAMKQKGTDGGRRLGATTETHGRRNPRTNPYAQENYDNPYTNAYERANWKPRTYSKQAGGMRMAVAGGEPNP